MITNGYIESVQNGIKLPKVYNYVNEEKLRLRLEEMLVDGGS
jgi:hypothetical protein